MISYEFYAAALQEFARSIGWTGTTWELWGYMKACNPAMLAFFRTDFINAYYMKGI